MRERIYNFDMMLRVLRTAKVVYVGTRFITEEVDYIRGNKADVKEQLLRYRDQAGSVTPLFDYCESTKEVWIG